MADWERARRAVEHAIDRLPVVTDRDVAARLGISRDTLHTWRNRSDPERTQPRTLRNMERGLGWDAGLIRRIAEEGAEPPSIDEQVAAVIEDGGMDPDEVDELTRRVDELTRELGEIGDRLRRHAHGE